MRDRIVAIQSFPCLGGSYSDGSSLSAYCTLVMAPRAALHARFTMCGKHLRQSQGGEEELKESEISPNSILNSIKFDFPLVKCSL